MNTNVPFEYLKEDNYNKIIIHFMDAISVMLNYGKGSAEFDEISSQKIEIEEDNHQIVSDFIALSMGYVAQAFAPSLFQIMVDQMFYIALSKTMITERQIGQLVFSRQLLYCLFNDDDLVPFFDTSRMWSKKVREYARTTFYRQFPEDVRERYHLHFA